MNYGLTKIGGGMSVKSQTGERDEAERGEDR